MSFYKILIVIVTYTLLVSCSQKTLRVVCIGDSITQGKVKKDSIAELSYRFYLWQKLDSLGLKVDMVGSNPYWFNENQKKRVSLPNSQYTEHTFDPDHEAWYGITSSQVLFGGFTHDGIRYAKPFQKRLKKYKKPDLALVDIGGNDGQKDSLNANNNITQLIEQLFERNPKMDILLAKSTEPWNRYINHSVEKIISMLKTEHPKIKILYVDLASDWVNCPEANGSNTFDWVHPNTSGQKKMAEKWFKAYLSKRDIESPKFQPALKIINKTDSTATVQWSPAVDDKFVAGYEIMLDGKLANWRFSECGKFDRQCLALIPTNTYTIKELKKNTDYKIAIIAVDFANNKTSSNTIIVSNK